jgi:uncharacterized membrane protein
MNTIPIETHWILGPQLIGAVLLLVGAIQYRFPPKRINNWYGYRTPASQKNQSTWDEANRFSARYTIKVAIILIIGGLLSSALLVMVPMPVKINVALTILLLLAASMGAAIGLITATEKHLTKTFGD